MKKWLSICLVVMMALGLFSGTVYGKVDEESVVLIVVTDEDDDEYALTGVVIGEDSEGYFILTSVILLEAEVDFEFEIIVDEESVDADWEYDDYEYDEDEDEYVGIPLVILKTEDKSLKLTPVKVTELGIDEDDEYEIYGYEGENDYDEDDTDYDLESETIDEIDEEIDDMDGAYEFDGDLDDRFIGGPLFDEDDNLVGHLLTNYSGSGLLLDFSEYYDELEEEGYLKTGGLPIEPMYLGIGIAAVGIILIVILIARRKKSSTPAGNSSDQGQSVPVTPQSVGPQTGVVTALLGTSGQYAGSSVKLDTYSIILGRDPNQCNLVYPNELDTISRRHAEVRFNAGTKTYEIIDYSTRGTFVNQVKLTKGLPKTLRVGDVIYISGNTQSFKVI